MILNKPSYELSNNKKIEIKQNVKKKKKKKNRKKLLRKNKKKKTYINDIVKNKVTYKEIQYTE